MNNRETGVFPEDRFMPLDQEMCELSEAIDVPSSFMLRDEKDGKGESIPAEAAWIKLVDGERTLEGKIYQPLNGKGNGELIIICPGLPGDGVVRFEEAHVKEMIAQGYTVFCARHNGLNISEGAPDKYAHCPEKKKWAKESGQTHLGGEFSFAELGREALTAIKCLEAKFKKINLVGHSAGSLSIMSSLGHLAEELPELREKIGGFVSLAGAIGEYDKELMNRILDWIDESGVLNAIDKAENLQQFAAREDYLRQVDWSQFPNMSTTFITPTEVFPKVTKADEYVTSESAKHLAELMREQGCTRVRTVDYANAKSAIGPGKESHDFDHLSSGQIMRGITGETIDIILSR